MKDALLAKIGKREARAAVIGGGYVGLPLAVAIAEAGYTVTVVDVDAAKVTQINAGTSYVTDVPSTQLAPLVERGVLKATTDFSQLREVDCISICVPTPLTKTRDPDISYILAAAREIAQFVEPGTLVVLESTTYPGTTREVIFPILNNGKMWVGESVFLCFSPERIDPGNETWKVKNTPKVIGGITPTCGEVGRAYYETFIDTIVPVQSTEAAEMVKLLENTFRAVNIALVNEVAIMSQRLDLDTWEVIEAAATKPFGFMPFYPGPGLGGHCIPIDPLYLSWKLKTLNYNARFIALASEVNGEMPHHVVDLVGEALNDRKKAINGSRVLVLGMAYKKDIGDLRESPALEIFRRLREKGAAIEFTDPHVPQIDLDGETIRGVDLDPATLPQYDCVVIATDHSVYDAQQIVEAAQLVVDTRNLTRDLRDRENIVRL